MAKSKRPVHEVLSSWLIASEFNRPILLDPLLRILAESDMKAEHAHWLAREHASLPRRLELVGRKKLAAFAKDVLADLCSRTDDDDEGENDEEASLGIPAGFCADNN